MKKIAIVQSNYIPWKGYFDMIAAVDEFILGDDVQYTKQDWRNRNRIKASQGLKWLTVPIKVGNHLQKIKEVEIDDQTWAKKHWRALVANYQKAPYFAEIAYWLKPLYERLYQSLSELNRCFIEKISAYLGIRTKLSYSWDYPLAEGKIERLIGLCLASGASEYISGPAAKAYIDETLFHQAGVKLTWFDYSGYPEYSQGFGAFEHGVSVLDLLFNCGKDSIRYMKHVKP